MSGDLTGLCLCFYKVTLEIEEVHRQIPLYFYFNSFNGMEKFGTWPKSGSCLISILFVTFDFFLKNFNLKNTKWNYVWHYSNFKILQLEKYEKFQGKAQTLGEINSDAKLASICRSFNFLDWWGWFNQMVWYLLVFSGYL